MLPSLAQLALHPAFALEDDDDEAWVGGFLSDVFKSATASTASFGKFTLEAGAVDPLEKPMYLDGDGWILLQIELARQVDLMPGKNAKASTETAAMGRSKANRYMNRVEFYVHPKKSEMYIQTYIYKMLGISESHKYIPNEYLYVLSNKKMWSAPPSPVVWELKTFLSLNVRTNTTVAQRYIAYGLSIKLQEALKLAMAMQDRIPKKAAAKAFFDVIKPF